MLHSAKRKSFRLSNAEGQKGSLWAEQAKRRNAMLSGNAGFTGKTSIRWIWLGLLGIGMIGMLSGTAPLSAQEAVILADFEMPESLNEWQFVSGTPRLVQEGATHGRQALEIVFDPKGEYYGAYLYWNRPPRDWSPYDALVIDVTNPNERPIPGYVLIADQAWADKGRSYWNRHNAETTFPPGFSQWIIPVRGLYRGEAGSRNNDIKRDIDPDSIVRVDLAWGAKGTQGSVIIDHIRFVKVQRPAGIWAFDFGPPSQATMLGWTPVTWNTNYTKELGYGWGPTGGNPWNGAARDTTFGPMLLRDFCEAGGYNFHIDVPPGRYRLTVIYENCGYWGGEQAKQRERRIFANGQLAWSETRPDGPAHHLYRFEDVEPIGVDIWDTYMAAEITKPFVFEAEAAPEGLTLRFEADRVWGSKLAALALHRVENEQAAAWLAAQMQALAKEFRQQAVCLDPPAAPFTPPAAWQPMGFIVWPVSLEEEITPNTMPPHDAPAPSALVLEREAVRGEVEPFCLALRPVRDLGECELQLAGLRGPEGSLLPSRVSVVFYNTSRGFNTTAYHIRPHTLREQKTLRLPANVTREIIVTVHVPEDARPGEYRGALQILGADQRKIIEAPLRLRVHPVTLSRQTEFLMGFFGLEPPDVYTGDQWWQTLEETLRLLQEHGMNAVSGGPSWRLRGWQNGQPVVDFGEMDRFFALLKKYGLGRAVNGYGGARFLGLNDGYQIGETGKRVEEQSGLSYEEALRRAWGVVDEHARANGWPLIYYGLCDETRVRETAERELEFMQLMSKISALYPQTIRTSGSYSVHFRARPTDPNDLLYWHQRFFETLDVSQLNLHDESVMEEARRLGKEIHIYNQGTSRYSFGLYQWSEFRQGVRARWQWHLNILHGYQFFDLDGREPDTAMICYGRRGLYPTIHFERCREGAEDFYLYQTLWNAVQQAQAKGERKQAVEQAESLLRELEGAVKLNQRQPPAGYDPEALKRRVVAALERLQ